MLLENVMSNRGVNCWNKAGSKLGHNTIFKLSICVLSHSRVDLCLVPVSLLDLSCYFSKDIPSLFVVLKKPLHIKN